MSRTSRTILSVIFAAPLLLALAACPAPQGQEGSQGQAATTSGAPKTPPPQVALVLSDLGIGDGSYAREANETLQTLHRDGIVDYTRVGQVPDELTVESITGDVGLPTSTPGSAGSMDLAAAEKLLDDMKDTDLLVLTTPLLLERALDGISAGEFSAKAVLVLDNDGYKPPKAPPPAPVYVVQYDVKDIAFLSGVAAAQSSNNAMFVVMAAASDPQAEDFLAASAAGAKFQSSGSQVATITVPVDKELGYVTPQTYREAVLKISDEMGKYFLPNHYIVSLGRATPTVMLALTGDTENAYVVGAYADYRRVRPARVVGCAVKHPGKALDYILRNATDPAGIAKLADKDGLIKLGLEEDAVGFTDFEYYGRYNPDSDDIEKAVTHVEALIRAGELDYKY